MPVTQGVVGSSPIHSATLPPKTEHNEINIHMGIQEDKLRFQNKRLKDQEKSLTEQQQQIRKQEKEIEEWIRQQQDPSHNQE